MTESALNFIIYAHDMSIGGTDMCEKVCLERVQSR